MSRHFGVAKGFGARADAVAIEIDAFEGGAVAAGGDEDVLGFEGGGVFAIDDDLAGTCDAARAGVGRDFVLFEQALDAFGEGVDDAGLAFEHRLEVEADFTRLDAVALEVVLGLDIALARFEEGLAGDATHAQAGAAECGFLLNAGHVHAQLRRTDSRDIAARARANNH